MLIDAKDLGFAELNEKIRDCGGECTVKNCIGQRFTAAGMSELDLTLEGIPGNALGAYLAGANITVKGNAQDAVGDTMNSGTITVHGNIGDAAGYAMRGGALYIKGNAGYRAGIHMKEYKDKKPVIVIGGRAGSFLGEYQAGGIIIVLGMNKDKKPVLGNFPCAGMHGGKMMIRGDAEGIKFPAQVRVSTASDDDIEEIRPYLEKFCDAFGFSDEELINEKYTMVTPDTKNPYKQMYVAN